MDQIRAVLEMLASSKNPTEKYWISSGVLGSLGSVDASAKL